ncbi:hypothetical protein [Campylobacter sp. 19-13652]|uniref:hypothetical protein n=1 Tax=Campylobacter sp. 19-13652 TaxID=2840180 RepID=UPI001C77C345|nr:hypothetical protein [Campylobacter sp. 19-13652]BCX79287.1 hypothetical protein LBC_07490 [Campylobacter sp. 19-13652]
MKLIRNLINPTIKPFAKIFGKYQINYATAFARGADADNATPYSSGMQVRKDDRIVYKGRLYQATRDISSLTTEPNSEANATALIDMGASNANKFQDELINSQTISSKSTNALIIDVDTDKNFIDRVNLLNIIGESVSIFQNEIKIKEIPLRARRAKSWLDFFTINTFLSYKKDISISLPPIKGRFLISIYPNSNGAALGHLSIGKGIDIGHCLYEPRISVLDYSRKKKDDWGNITLAKGKTATLLDIKAVVYTELVDEVKETLRDACGELVTLVADERDEGIKSLSLHGFIKEFNITVSNSQTSELNLSFEGVI